MQEFDRLVRHTDEGDLLHGFAILRLRSLNIQGGEFQVDVSQQLREHVIQQAASSAQSSYRDAERLPGEPPRSGILSVKPPTTLMFMQASATPRMG